MLAISHPPNVTHQASGHLLCHQKHRFLREDLGWITIALGGGKKNYPFFFVLPLIFHASLFIFQGIGRQTTFCVMRFYIGHGWFVNIKKKGHILILSNVQLLSSVSCWSCFGFDFYFGLSCLILLTHLPSSCFLFSCPHYLMCEYLSFFLCSVPMLVFICFAINVAYLNCLLQCSPGPSALFRAVVTAEWWSEVLWIYISEAPEEVQEVSRIAGL